MEALWNPYSWEGNKILIKLVSKFGDVFHDHLGITNVLEHEIRTIECKTDACQKSPDTIFSRRDSKKRDELQVEYKHYWNFWFPYCSSFVIVSKKDGTKNFGLNFFLLKNKFIFDSEPMPGANDFWAVADSRSDSKSDKCPLAYSIIDCFGHLADKE